jgi:hypothetical protein
MGNLAAARAHDFNETANDGSISAGRTKVSTHTKLPERQTHANTFDFCVCGYAGAGIQI